MRILVSDVGGTHVRLAFAEARESSPQGKSEKIVLEIHEHEVYPSRDYEGLEPAIGEFLRRHPQPFEHAGFAIAGPVIDNSAKLTNLTWKVSATALSAFLQRGSVYLLNDLEAQAYGLGDMQSDDLITVQGGVSAPEGNLALLAPGTGLGKATVYRGHDQYRVLKSEGGHVDFGARDLLELELLQFLTQQFDHVSWERILSGPGLFEVYRFLRKRSGTAEPPWLRDAFAAEAPSMVVSRVGLAGEETVTSEAVRWFVKFLARQTASTALDAFATGGVYLGGGIVPRLLPLIQRPEFLAELQDQGRMRSLIEKIPVQIVHNEFLGLIGAARFVLGESTGKKGRTA